MASLSDLFPGAPPRPVAGLAVDSRAVRPGFAFVAVPGSRAHGQHFVADALRRGAVAIVAEGERPADLPAEIAYVPVPDARRALALGAARLHPGQPEIVVAVTGTSGKSSVADFTRQIFGRLGRRSASLGTIGVVTSEGARYGSLTTPDPITLHETLDRLAAEGIDALAMEASSHGIDQRRLDGVRLAAAAFTNLGRDHLDYHGTTEAYLAAKLRLFDTLLPETATAVVNTDAEVAPAVLEACAKRGLRVLTVGRAGRDLRLLATERAGFAQRLRLRVADRDQAVDLPLAGDFQVENALVAAGLVLAALGSERAEDVIVALGGLVGVPGRMERVGEVRGALCVVDYAHKPEALEHVLASLRPFATGRLICVFGCGGDRDRGKRPLMGAIAARLADLAIVTDDNPRSEDPAAIRREILAGAPGAREIGDRAEAIRVAVAEARPGDVVVVAGKGHETGQIVGDRTLPFSDHAVLRAAIAAETP
ncbi:MAG: UDP-N-acetylmuramoyl-L-alanyl-D-glutamate--2,6-diaminopimelate ligase [Methylobacteriaceae bacterium]|nr:UDP-N-acetylmuramoyl-L-alanyl-D-glutamate--2,6-diaminopimelate ligase [Methylobacteriaceae bacterium]